MVYHRRRMNSLQAQFVFTSILLLLLTSKLAFAAHQYCRGVDCRSEVGRTLCRVCARPPPGKRTDTQLTQPQPPPSVRELFAARLDDNEDDQFNKYNDPSTSNTCILELALRRLQPTIRTEIIKILENALEFSAEEFGKWTDE